MDATLVPLPRGGKLAISTQSCVVNPIQFPGGDIGRLALLRATNNLAAMGATPRYAAVSFVLEEGLQEKVLAGIVDSLAHAAAEAVVEVVAGDTRVVPGGAAESIYLNVTGIGHIPPGLDLSRRRVRDGDRVLVSGPIAEHGAAVIAAREGMAAGRDLASDARSLHLLSRAAFALRGVRCLRDIGRGGLASALIHLAGQAGVALSLRRDRIPLREIVARVCEGMGLDPLYVPSAGVLIAVASPSAADNLMTVWVRMQGAERAAVIGEVEAVPKGTVRLQEKHRGPRNLELLTGENVTRVG